jgi:hypothetical protein
MITDPWGWRERFLALFITAMLFVATWFILA